MSTGLITAVVCVSAALVGVLFWKRRESRKFVAGRLKVSLSQQYQESKIRDQASEDIFCTVLSKVGQCYELDPELLRDTDQLGDLSSMDSWTLGAGENDLMVWLRSKGLTEVAETSTLADLITAMSRTAC